MSTGNTDRIDAHVWRISAVVIVGSIMSILDTTIVNVALATLGRELHSTIAEIQWVVTGYMLSLAAVIPVTGWAARRFGAKRVYVISLALFTAGSALCGLATTSTELIVFRVLQGIGGGMILPIGQLMMAEAAGPKRMGRVMSVVAVPAMLAPILGPTLGGLILDNVSWRWIFFVNLPIGAIAILAALRTLAKSKPAPTDSLDFRGLVLMSTGLPLVTYGLAEIGVTGGFTAVKVVVPILIGAALIAAFAVHALRVPRPLLNLRLYRRPTFASASIAMFCLGAALFGGMILLPLYLQGVRHENVLDTGLLTAPQGLGAALVMPLAGKLADRMGGGPLTLFGVILTTVSTVPFGFVGAHTSLVWLSVAMFVRGMGIGFAFMPAMAAAFASLERSELSDATPQMNVLQRVGGSIGTAILAVVLQRALVGTHDLAGQAGAYGTAFWASAG
jgi:EmrB/QacA subfamily drug resistance transporter